MRSPLRVAVVLGCSAAVAGAWHAAVNRRHLGHLRPGVDPVAERVSVLVPARDEAATIGACVRCLRGQEGVADLEIVVLDDHSVDGTAAVAAAAAEGDQRVRIVAAADEPPPGWLGKPYACARLADEATGAVLVFVDADVHLEPNAVAAAVAARHGADLLSAWPRQVAASPLARLVQPLQQWSWLTTLPLDVAGRSNRSSLAAANGQFLVADAASYSRVGGHAAVRGAVLDDIELARAFRRAGMRTDVVDAAAAASCRMYDSDAALVDGYAKSLWTAFGGPRRGIAVAAALAAVYVVPPAYAVLGRHPLLRLVGAAGYAAGVASRVVAARETGGRAWPDALAHPLSIALFAWLMGTSLRRHRLGALRWRGRPVDVGSGGGLQRVRPPSGPGSLPPRPTRSR